eukprot:1374067-Amorphochlora_amoeboformis.AAC.1
MLRKLHVAEAAYLGLHQGPLQHNTFRYASHPMDLDDNSNFESILRVADKGVRVIDIQPLVVQGS